MRIPLAPQNRTSLLPGGAFLVFSSLYPQVRILGIDSSPDMIASARKLHPDCDFDVLDVGSLDELDTDFDVVFSNACLQWVPNHERVLPSMLRRLNAGGLTSAQFTENINLPPHIIMRETACEPKWRQWISEIRRYYNLGGDNFDVSAYYDLLAPLSAHVDVWETNYYHALPGYEAILDWYRGTGLRPYLAQLPDDGLYLRVLRASVERAIDFSYVRGLVSRPATCFDGGCRRQGASPVPYQWFARQEGGCDGVHHIGLRREVPAENRGQDRRGHARRR